MKYLSFRCIQCGTEASVMAACGIGDYISHPCKSCGGRLQRIIKSFQYSRPMQEHYNASVGRGVNSRRDFTEELKRQSERATLETGVEHNYVEVDPSDKTALGVTDEGLYETEKRRHDSLVI